MHIICRMFGHWWRGYWPTPGLHADVLGAYYCRICGATKELRVICPMPRPPKAV